MNKLAKCVKLSITITKCDYFKNKFDLVGKNSKRMWKTIDNLLGRNSNTNQITQICKTNSDLLLTSPEHISDEFNDFSVFLLT